MTSYLAKFPRKEKKRQYRSMAAIRQTISDLMDKPNVYEEIERHLSEPGVIGRSAWDRCFAVNILLEADKLADKKLSDHVKSGYLTLPVIGEQLIIQLRSEGLVISRGRIIGMLEQDTIPEEAEPA